jgi:hypothetical protein
MKITEWALAIIFGAIVLAVILAIYLAPVGSFVQSQNNNTFVQLIGMSGAVNSTGLSMISLGKTLQLSLIVLGILVMVVVLGLLLIMYYLNKNKRNDNYPPF